MATTRWSIRSRLVDSLIHSIPRSWASDPPATDHPWCSSPTRFSAGTITSVKKTSLKSAWSRSVSSAMGRVSMPGVVMSMMSTLIPACLAASGSVRTKQKQ